MATKSKFQSLSARRSSPRTRSRAVPEPITSPRTCSRFVREPNSSLGTDKIPRTPFSFKAITPVVGTLKSVSLSDWWLTKQNGLGVSGFESKGGSEVRLFSSGTISVRHESTTLETSDGITVCISGFINRSRTLQNGFSSEACNRFLLGFPYYWEDYNEEESVEENSHFTVSFDDIHVNRYQDVLFTSSLCFKNNILDDVVDSIRDLVCPSTEKSRMDEESLVPSVVGVKTKRTKHCKKCGGAGHNIRTCSKKAKDHGGEVSTQPMSQVDDA